MKLILSFNAVLLSLSLQAKLTDPTEVAKRKASDRTNNAIDSSVDKGLDKVEACPLSPNHPTK